MVSLNVLTREHSRLHRGLDPTEYRTPAASGLDADALAKELRGRIKGEVRFDDGSRALYATDGSNYRQVPIGVVVPRDEHDVIESVDACHRYGAPLLSRGCGTSLAGQCCNVAVIMDFSKYLRDVLDIDPAQRRARVHPGVIQYDLHKAAEKHGLTFGPDPATHRWCTLGGMIGNNSCGVHSQMAGRTADNVEELDILLYDGTRLRVGKASDGELESIIRAGGRRGQIYSKLKDLRDRYADLIRRRYPRIPRRVSGYNLDELLPENGFHVARALVGSESTCCVVLEAVVNLVPWPKHRTLLLLGYPNIFSAGDHVPEVNEAGPMGLEALDKKFITDLRNKHLQIDHLRIFPQGGAFLLVEFGGDTPQESRDKARALVERLKKKGDAPTAKIVDDKHEENEVWQVRESGLGATAHVPGEKENWEGWEDAAVPPDKVGDYLRDFKKLLDRYQYVGSLYGHFGQGCIHTRLDFGLKSAEGVAKYRRFIEDAADLVVRHGGSLSGEHGDGQSRAEMLPKMFGPELVRAFEEFKSIWDPDWKMNPGKVVRPYRIDENLRYGPDYDPPEPRTHFKFTGDGYSFRRATERCVGVGKCRREEGGTMCPSYMVTHEEKHTTRGRAHMLFEMLQGDAVHEGWKSEHVKESLDLCLACKGCKGDCPVHVDMATYKAEFLSHYYDGRLRPRHAYAFGWVHVWSRLASAAPTLANLFSQTPVLRDVLKWVAGVAPQRRLPAFAPQSFKDWFASRPAKNTTASPVVLWPDTFNNYFHPDTARAAVEVLEDAGFRVMVPMQDMCCGRPLYDYGFLGMAERWLRQILDTMAPEIEAGVPFVVLEPSCGAVFRDELTNLLPNDLNARRLHDQTFLLSEFLAQKAPHYQLPKVAKKALVHGHCHHRAIMGVGAEEQVLKDTGLDFDFVDSGCCGMAGAFGFEKGEHYDVSVKCGERVLIPRVRDADDDTVIIANGFSCREQIRQTTDREALHLAQVLRMGMWQRDSGSDGSATDARPEAGLIKARRKRHRAAAARAAAFAGAGVAAGILLYQLSKHEERKHTLEV
jgi:FAD/FMN-containing dehydrogenase/Fe-S oxidoreductase